MKFLLTTAEAIVSFVARLIPGKKWENEEINEKGPWEWFIRGDKNA